MCHNLVRVCHNKHNPITEVHLANINWKQIVIQWEGQLACHGVWLGPITFPLGVNLSIKAAPKAGSGGARTSRAR